MVMYQEGLGDKMNKLKNRIKSGEVLIGSWINSASPIIAELMSHIGFDFLVVDAEHSAVDLPQTQQLFQAIKSGNTNCSPIVRVPSAKYSITKRFMDAGAQGIIAPLVRTKQEAIDLVQGTKYFPQGMRGVGFCRANNYGIDIQEYLEESNEDSLLIVQIEHVDAVNNIDDILSVEGIDVALIGPYDLSASMGIATEFDHPQYIEARNEILRACKQKSIAAGIHVVQPKPEEAKDRIDDGFQFIGYSLDITMISSYFSEDLGKIRTSTFNNGDMV